MNRPSYGRYQMDPIRRNSGLWNPPDHFDFMMSNREYSGRNYVGRCHPTLPYNSPVVRVNEGREDLVFRGQYPNLSRDPRERELSGSDPPYAMNASLDNTRFRCPEEDYFANAPVASSGYRTVSPYRGPTLNRNMLFEDEASADHHKQTQRSELVSFNADVPHATGHLRSGCLSYNTANFEKTCGSEREHNFIPQFSAPVNRNNQASDDHMQLEERGSHSSQLRDSRSSLILQNRKRASLDTGSSTKRKRLIELDVRTSKQNETSRPSLQISNTNSASNQRDRSFAHSNKASASKPNTPQMPTNLSKSSVDVGTRLLTVPLKQMTSVFKSLSKVRPRISVVFEVSGHITAIFACGSRNQMCTRFQLVDTANTTPLDCVFYDIDQTHMIDQIFEGALFWCIGRFIQDKHVFQCFSIRPVADHDSRLSKMLYILTNDVIKELTLSGGSFGFEKEA